MTNQKTYAILHFRVFKEKLKELYNYEKSIVKAER